MPTTTVSELKRSISVCLRQVKAGEGIAKAGVHNHRTLTNHTRRDNPLWLSDSRTEPPASIYLSNQDNKNSAAYFSQHHQSKH